MKTPLRNAPINFHCPHRFRERMAKVLAQQLADAIDLQIQLTHAQWNIRGPQFLALHLFFDQLASVAGETVGEIARRLGELGERSPHVLQVAVTQSRLPVYPSRDGSDELHIAVAARVLESFSASAGEAARKAFDLQDFGSTGILARAGQTTDKLHGMILLYLKRRQQATGMNDSAQIGIAEEEGKAA